MFHIIKSYVQKWLVNFDTINYTDDDKSYRWDGDKFTCLCGEQAQLEKMKAVKYHKIHREIESEIEEERNHKSVCVGGVWHCVLAFAGQMMPGSLERIHHVNR